VRSPLSAERLAGHLVFEERVRQQLLELGVSVSSSFRRLASETLMPPNLLRGEAVGVTYADDEELTTGDKEERRDRHRWGLDPASSEDRVDRTKDGK
jgi:hypothetical protein